MFISALILTAGLTSFKMTGANITIQRKGNQTDESCECGKSITLSCIFKTNTSVIEWMDENDIIPIAICRHQDCLLNPEYVEQYNISFDMTGHIFDLTIQKVTMELNGRTLVCSDGSNTDSYNISVKDYEPTLIEDRNSGSILATSGCISPDTVVSFKWIKIYASSNVETEFNPKGIMKSNTSCTNDSDCGNSMHVHFSETIVANASAEGNYYLKVTAMYVNESKESFSSDYSGQKYIIEEQDEEQFISDSVYKVVVVLWLVVAFLALLAAAITLYCMYSRHRFFYLSEVSFICCVLRSVLRENTMSSSQRQSENRNDKDEDCAFIDANLKNSATASTKPDLNPESQSCICNDSEVRYDEVGFSLRRDESQSEMDPNIFTTAQNKDTEKNEEQPSKGFINSVYGIVSNYIYYFSKSR